MQRLHGFRILGVLALCVLSAFLLAGGATAAKESAPVPVSIMFLLQSQGATFAKALGVSSYRVTFTGTSTKVYAFTDRPNRMANHSTVGHFVATWKKSDFEKSPPNAALVLTKPEGGDTVVIATLSHPRWNKAKHALTFDAKLLRDITSHKVSLYDDAGANVLPAHVTHVKIFVDTYSPCGPPGTVPTLAQRHACEQHR